MTVLGQLETTFRIGVLCVGDDEAIDESKDRLQPGPALIILKTRNPTVIRVAATDIDDPAGPAVFDGTIRVTSGLLRVGGVLDDSALWIAVPPGDLLVRLHVTAIDPGPSADRVDVVLPTL